MEDRPSQPQRHRFRKSNSVNRIYLDHNATIPILPRVREGLLELLDSHHWGNPSSLHEDGRHARKILEEARDRVAFALHVEPSEIVFTSGGTESNNLAITGLVTDDSSISTSTVEHPSVLEPVKKQHQLGRSGSLIPVDPSGRLELDQVPDKGLVSIQWINNETGICQDLDLIGEAVHRSGGKLHSDGAQGFFREPIHLGNSNLDSASITSHKSGGPSGVGALWVRKGLLHQPSTHGGPQEKKIRPGTENLLAIHGMGLLAESFSSDQPWNRERLKECRNQFANALSELPNHQIIQQSDRDWPGCINVSFSGIHAETLLVRLDMVGISASSGSACSSGAREPSHVLKAMGIADKDIRGSIRISLGPDTTIDHMQQTARHLTTIVTELRQKSAGQPPVL